nr:MAG TPA: hypothetical protein [Herelleviridae sp.]
MSTLRCNKLSAYALRVAIAFGLQKNNAHLPS